MSCVRRSTAEAIKYRTLNLMNGLHFYYRFLVNAFRMYWAISLFNFPFALVFTSAVQYNKRLCLEKLHVEN